jgi:hypothetical protein
MKMLPAVLLWCLLRVSGAAEAERPCFRDFVGLCGHTVQFKPALYRPVCGWVRDYHPVQWDLAEDTTVLPEWPFAKNRVSWEAVYGSWQKEGLKTTACLMVDEMGKDWKDPERDAEAYAKSFAAQFGPGGKWPFVEALEIGNEPGLIEDAAFQKLHAAMARGVRAGNPKLKIVTCNVEAGKSERYWKSADLFREMPQLYDVLQIHRYAIAEQWPVWRRTYPENADVPFLSSVQALLDWRDKQAPGKPVWVTEFGWDSSTKQPDPAGPDAKWIGSTDEEQAMWMVRSFFLFSGMGVEKAFCFFFNDEDKPSLHAASGLTRNFQPKPAYHAVAWMLARLHDYRFSRVVQASLTDGYLYEFQPERAGQPKVIAAWRATGSGGIKWPAGLGKIQRAERMPLAAGAAEIVDIDPATGSVPASGRPVLLELTP